MAAGMSDQAVKPNPVSQGYLGLRCFAIDLTLLPLGSELRIGERGYKELLAKQEDPSEIVTIAFTSSSLKWKTLGQGGV